MLFPRLNAIVDVEAASRVGWRAVDLARAFIAGGARFLQLRAKTLSGAAFLDLATDVVALARPAGAIVIVNDRADIAKLADADGVHLGQDDLSPAAARTILGERAIVGLSTHTADQLARAGESGASYIAIGPVFATSTKATGYEAVGLEMVRQAARVGPPVVAIGGITLENAAAVVAAGAASVAVIGGLVAHGDPEASVRQYLERLRV